MKKTILLVDDDPSVCKLLKAALEKNGYNTVICTSGENVLPCLEAHPTEAVILDIILPGIDGLEVLRRIRNHTLFKQTPVIMLTTKDSEVETVIGLEMGADEYLSKPVRYHELVARLKKVLQNRDKLHSTGANYLLSHGMEINLENRSVLFNQVLIPLTFLEYELLTLMAKNPGKVFSREYLLELLWDTQNFVETRTVDVHVRRLRSKLEEQGVNPNIIETIRSVGYRMTAV